ncbi:hypothetical protein, partial [Thiorhodovibrio winogradskyi]|uniref:hypothetical protein n=1 Tax=Thiorhodovibrio winogradskyi TaxID=77007 RepID=UPI001A930D45
KSWWFFGLIPIQTSATRMTTAPRKNHRSNPMELQVCKIVSGVQGCIHGVPRDRHPAQNKTQVNPIQMAHQR